MKVGLDIHGVINKYPERFKKLSQRLRVVTELTRELKMVDVEGDKWEDEVHIITGSMQTEELIQEIRGYGIWYTHFFSVSDYLISQGHTPSWSSPNDPWFNKDVWTRAKGDYCARVGIDMHFDDSRVYCKYFPETTMYCLVT